MKRLTAWLAGFVGGAALYRLFRRRPAPAPAPAPATGPDPADALKAKLAETRAGEPDPAPEQPPAPGPEDVEDRRRAVHEQARASIDEMNSSE